MTTAEVLAKARALVASGGVDPFGLGSQAFDALEAATGGDRKAFVKALEFLDALTPHPFTFVLWADGADFTSDGDQMTIVYRHDRTKAEVLALMGKASLRAARQEAGALP